MFLTVDLAKDPLLDIRPKAPIPKPRGKKDAGKAAKSRETVGGDSDEEVDDEDLDVGAEEPEFDDDGEELGPNFDGDYDDEDLELLAEMREQNAENRKSESDFSPVKSVVFCTDIADLCVVLAEKGLQPFQPTLWLAPPSATPVAIAEVKNHFPHRRLIIFLGNSANAKSEFAGLTFHGSARDLQKFIDGLDVLNPATANIMVVSSYSTCAARMLRLWQCRENGERYPLTRMGRDECREQGLDPDQFEELHRKAWDLKKQSTGWVASEPRARKDMFGNGVFDEAHELKGEMSLRLQAIDALAIRRLLLLTASPFVNRLRDLTTVLRLVESVAEKSMTSTGTGVDLEIEDYKKIRAEMQEAGGSWLKLNSKQKQSIVRALHTRSFRTQMTRHDDNGDVARQIVPAPMSIFVLRRVAGQKMLVHGKEYEIAADIPPYHCTTVELKMTPIQQTIYDRVHQEKFGDPDLFIMRAEPGKNPPVDLATHPHGPSEEEMETARENIAKARSLACASNNAGIQLLYDNDVAANAADVKKW